MQGFHNILGFARLFGRFLGASLWKIQDLIVKKFDMNVGTFCEENFSQLSTGNFQEQKPQGDNEI